MQRRKECCFNTATQRKLILRILLHTTARCVEAARWGVLPKTCFRRHQDRGGHPHHERNCHTSGLAERAEDHGSSAARTRSVKSRLLRRRNCAHRPWLECVHQPTWCDAGVRCWSSLPKNKRVVHLAVSPRFCHRMRALRPQAVTCHNVAGRMCELFSEKKNQKRINDNKSCFFTKNNMCGVQKSSNCDIKVIRAVHVLKHIKKAIR